MSDPHHLDMHFTVKPVYAVTCIERSSFSGPGKEYFI